MRRAAPGRGIYVVLAAATLVIGLLVHLAGTGLHPAVRDVLGDALWTTMMLWWVSVVAPRAPLLARGAVALSISFIVEVSQLYHAGWIDSLRRTLPGHLVLGSGFDPRDLLAYTGGALAAMCLDHLIMARRSGRKIAT